MSFFGKISLFLVLMMVSFASLKAQDERSSQGNLSVGATFNTNLEGMDRSLPFWLHANKLGLFDQRSANSIFYTDFNQPLVIQDRLKFHTSGRIMARAAKESTLGIHTLSATVNYGLLTFKGGKFRDPIGMNYHPLSSGSMQYGTNAEPVPKIVLQTDGFVDIPLAQGYVQFSSYLSHGWFEDARYVENSYLHQKYFYLKINYKMLEGIGGVIHNVQWGGDHPTRGHQPSSLTDFWRVLWAKGAAGENENVANGEIKNVLGNSVAAYDFNLKVQLDRFRLTFYRLFYLEDKISTRFRSPWDGMWGGGIIRTAQHPVLKALLYEHVNTKRQDSFDFEPRGSASYYNNTFYPSGWTYKNRVLGNPLLLTNGSNTRPVYNNIIIAHHLGARGFLNPNIEWTAFYTFSRNYGERADQVIRYYPPPREETIYGEYHPLEELKKVNHSIYFGTEFTMPKYQKLELKAGLALDLGELYSNDRIGLTFGAIYNLY